VPRHLLTRPLAVLTLTTRCLGRLAQRALRPAKCRSAVPSHEPFCSQDFPTLAGQDRGMPRSLSADEHVTKPLSSAPIIRKRSLLGHSHCPWPWDAEALVSWPIPGPFPSGEPNSASDADLVAILLALGARRTLGGPGGFRWSSPGSSCTHPRARLSHGAATIPDQPLRAPFHMEHYR
jgi:hypothetical protein